ncbi:hypothetical protein RUM44_003620 [Polyplax serrata]|uniref:Uncharacterized protein n=1 Tax=Polyplax serrata TaxID=468196 RepID=A0ABR1AGY7_POLSC
MEAKSNLAQEYLRDFDLHHLDGVKREANAEIARAQDRHSDLNNNEDSGPIVQRLPSIHANNGTILIPPHAPPGVHHQILTPPIHNGDEHLITHEGSPFLGPMHQHHHHHHGNHGGHGHHHGMALYQSQSSNSRSEMMTYHPGTPGTPPDTPPSSRSTDSPLHYGMDSQHPQPPNSLNCLSKPEMDESAWIFQRQVGSVTQNGYPVAKFRQLNSELMEVHLKGIPQE